MCGIAGLIDFSGIDKGDHHGLRKVTSALKHRGPDADGFAYGDFFALGHRRLSIVDLSSSANQPMYSTCGNYVVVFNGEIYNHSEIRRGLEKKHKFSSTNSDTEVILNSFKEWGINCIDKFIGMFAICIVDIKNQECYLIRDRIGQKPLYFINKNNRILFSSEAHSLFQFPDIETNINNKAIQSYLTFLTIPSPKSFYDGIEKLEPGTFIKINYNGTSKQTYWNVSDYLNNPLDISEKEAIDETERLLEQSMFYRNLADAKTCIALSGGIDSSLNLYYSKKLGFNPSAINMSFGDHSNKFNENGSAKKFSEELGINLIVQNIQEGNLGGIMEEYLESQVDMPCGDPNGVLLSIMAKTVRSTGAKVLIVGEGGDEIGGYHKYVKHFNRYKRFKSYQKLYSQFSNVSPIYMLKTLDLYYKNKMVSGSHVHGFTETEQKRLLNRFDIENGSFKELTKYNSEITSGLDEEYFKQVSNLEYKLRLPEMILSRIDYPTMQHGVEARSPFMDHRLIEFSAQIPFSLRMKGGQPKYLLRKISESKLPTYIMESPKIGFGQLLTPFLNHELPKLFENEIIKTKEAPIEQFIPKKNLKYFSKQHNRNHNLGYRLWILYALNRWLKTNL